MENYNNGVLSAGNLKYEDNSLSKAGVSVENGPLGNHLNTAKRAGALQEVKPVQFCVSDDVTNDVKVSISRSDDFNKILERVAKTFGFAAKSFSHIVLVDDKSVEHSPRITTAAAFWGVYSDKYPEVYKAKFVAVLDGNNALVDARVLDVMISLSADCRSLCSQNPSRRVAFPWGSDWSQVSKVFTDAFGFPAATVEYFLIVDSEGDEMSSLLNTSDKFWKAASSFKRDTGNNLQVYLDDVTFEDIKSHMDRQTFLMHSENFTIALDCDSSCRAELFLPAGATWNQISDEVIMTLGLDSSTVLKKIVLQDAEHCPISADITTDTKFWKIYSVKYKQVAGTHFAVTVTSIERQQQFFEACARPDLSPTLLNIIKQGVDVNEICEDSSIPGGDVAELRSGIHLAIINSNSTAVRLLCSLDCVDLDRPDVCGMTPLHHACSSGNLDLMALLCERGAVFKGVNTLGKTALHCLAERGFDPCRGAAMKLSKVLVGEGTGKIALVTANAYDHTGATALICACKRGDLAIVKALVECGGIINMRDSNGMSPFLYAIHAGSLVVARYLLDQGANITARNNAGEDAFMVCAVTGNLKLAEYLLGLQLDCDTRNHAGQCLHEIAISCGNVAIADWFRSNGSGRQNLSAKALNHLIETDISLEKRLRIEEVNSIEKALGTKPPAFDAPSAVAKGIRAVIGTEPTTPVAQLKIPKKAKQSTVPEIEHFEPVQQHQSSDPISIDNRFSKSTEECPSPVSDEQPQLSSSSSSDASSPTAEYDFEGLDGAAIYSICNSGNKDKIQKMFDFGINLNAVESDGSDFTALHSACEKGNLKVAQSLLANNCNPNPFSFDGETPLYLACSHGYVAIAKALVAKGVDVKATVRNTTVLHAAAANMHLDLVTWLVKQEKFPVDVLNDAGFTALHETCRLNDSLMARLLVNLGAVVEARENNAPLHVACFMGHVDLAKWLVSKGANPNTMYRGRNCFFIACSGAQPAVAAWLDSIGTDIHACDGNDGRSALHAACAAEHNELSEWLMKKNDNYVKLRDNNFESAYCVALRTRNNELVNLVEQYMQKGVGKSVYDEQLKEELVDMLAKTVEEKQFMISNFILQRLLNVAPVDLVCSDGCTPLHFAAAIGNVTVMNYLISKGAHLNAKSHVGKAPIHYAAITGNIEAGNCLADAGADLMVTDVDARDAQMFSKYFKQKQFTKWFKTHPSVVKARTPATSFFSVFSCVSSATKDDISDDSEDQKELFEENP